MKRKVISEMTTIPDKSTETHKARTEPKKSWFNADAEIIWSSAIQHTVFAVTGIYGFLLFPYLEHWKSVIWGYAVFGWTMFGIMAGIHRLWTHRAYKAKLPFKIIVASGYLLSTQMTFKKWVLIHRLHHKYSDTDADPHNAKRGFFFSHIGWVITKRSQAVIDSYQQIDTRDLDADPVVTFCDKHYVLLSAMLQLFTIAVPVYFWNETWYFAVWSQYLRFVGSLHSTLTINSLAHLYGNKPYDKNIFPRENQLVSWLTLGEGWHNYHHTFPSDYRSPEFAGIKMDLPALIIELFEKIGWTYDLRKPNEKLVYTVIKKRGDEMFFNQGLSMS